jgi:hypothetical protein
MEHRSKIKATTGKLDCQVRGAADEEVTEI